MSVPVILYLNASHARDRSFQMTIAGIRRYAEARGWRVEADWAEEPWRPSVRARRLAAWVAELPRHTAVFAVNDVVANNGPAPHEV